MSKVGEGRTSDLIKRFESLALDSNSSAPPIRMPKRPSAVPATTTTTTTEGAPWSKLPSGAQPSHISTAVSSAPHAEDGQEPTASPPAHVPNSAGSAASSVQDLMTISSYSYSHTTPVSASSPRQPERMQSLLPGRSRASTTESVVRLNQTEAPKQRMASNSFANRQKSLVTALNQRANIDPAIQASSRSWLNSAERRIDEALLDLDSGDLENAYLRFMIACNIISDKVPKQKDFDSVKKDPKYIKLHKDMSTRILDELEKLSVELRRRPYVEPRKSVLTPEQVDKMESHFVQMYPENPLDSPLAPGSSSFAAAAAAASAAAAAAGQPSRQHQPNHSAAPNGATASPSSESKWLADRQSKFNEIDAQARRIDASAHSVRAQDPIVPGVSVVNRSRANNRNTMAISPPANSSAEYDSNIGKMAIEYFDPNATTCTPKELWALLEQSRTGISGHPLVLVLDIRPHQDFVWGRIDHRYVVNIDPIGMDKQKCTSKDISASLILVSEEQQQWFRQRDEFDIVVYASQSARSFSDAASKEIPALEAVNRAIYHYEYDRPLKRPPLFLIGGFDAWARTMGSDRCLWSDDARKSLAQASGIRGAKSPKVQPVPQVDIPSSLGGGSTGVPSAVSDALAALNGSPNRPYYSPPSIGIPSSGVNGQPAVAAGSVFDFFQQSNGYHPQRQQQSDGRHAPMHTSYTQGYSARMTPRVSLPEPSTAQLVSSPTSSQNTSEAIAAVVSAASPFEASVGTANSGVPGAHGTHGSMNRPALPPKPASLVSEVTAQVQRRKTIFDNPNYGFTGPAHVAPDGYAHNEAGGYPDAVTSGNQEAVDVQRKRRKPPKAPLPTVPQILEKPVEYAPQQQQQIQEQQQLPRISKAGMPPPPPPPAPNTYIPPKPPAYTQQQQQFIQHQQQQQQQLTQQYQQQLTQQLRTPNGNGFYNHPVAAGSDPSLNGRMHAGNNLRSSILYQTDILPPEGPLPATPMVPSTPASANFSDNASVQPRRRSQLSDTAAYGATGLKNFGNTCFMNCVIQCLVGTAPLARYFMQGGWKKDMVRETSGRADVTVEFARLVDNMWRGQYGSISPVGFRSAVGKCSEVFKGNDQEDAQEFASFLLDALHESLNRVYPRPKPERELTPEEEMQFETLPDIQQAELQWGKYIRRN
ncbi:ubiquitin-specific protease doa4, partial [Coemansia sp. RSA 2559]